MRTLGMILRAGAMLSLAPFFVHCSSPTGGTGQREVVKDPGTAGGGRDSAVAMPSAEEVDSGAARPVNPTSPEAAKDASMAVDAATTDPAKTDAATSSPADAAIQDPGPDPCAEKARLDPGTHTLRFMHEGNSRSYLLRVPEGDLRPLPLVLNLHGSSSNGVQQQLFSAYDGKADAEGFLVAYPDGWPEPGAEPGVIETNLVWNAGSCCTGSDRDRDDVGFLRALVADIEARHCVDRTRLYAIGMSNGGMMAYRLACEAADLFAAVASVAGTLGLPPDGCRPSRPIPLLHVHGTADERVDYNGGRWLGARSATKTLAERNGCSLDPVETFRNEAAVCETYGDCAAGADVILCTLPGVGHCWPGTLLCFSGQSTLGFSTNDVSWDLFSRFSIEL